MRRLWISLAFLTGFAALAPAGEAQNFDDPFVAYFGFFLPRQAALAARPGPEMSINEISAARQVMPLTERAGLYDPPAGIGNDVYDPNHPFANRGSVRASRLQPSGISNTNINGAGPRDYYHRTQRYYPSLRNGRGPNSYIATTAQSVLRRRIAGCRHDIRGHEHPRRHGQARLTPKPRSDLNTAGISQWNNWTGSRDDMVPPHGPRPKTIPPALLNETETDGVRSTASDHRRAVQSRGVPGWRAGGNGIPHARRQADQQCQRAS